MFVKDRTFSDLVELAGFITNRIVGALVRMLGWDFPTAECSKRLSHPEIIFQKADTYTMIELQGSSPVVGDGVIPDEHSLARALLDDPACPKKNRVVRIISITENMDGLAITFCRDLNAWY